MATSRVPLPPEVPAKFEVFLNGVRQREGADYRVEGRTLVFGRPLASEGKLGFWRWTSIFLGLVGTYRQNDSVDVHYYTPGGEHRTAVYLDIEHDEESEDGR